ncbi:MAG: succinylglutamate-semialdehyde dehydrogenase [Opitutaceae bacterium]|nr:succinylglutamate-semialdehyde dehydrogenase [Opitutaceae bacterium]
MTAFSSINPATGETVWTGRAADASAVNAAVERARAAFPAWARAPLAERERHLRAFAAMLETRKTTLADAISREVGKPTWEALTEVQTMITKVDFAVRAHAQRCAEFAGGPAVTRFRPHGVVAVFGPFNFPGHLPNGHIVPALLAGNTVVFKPSEHAPFVAELTAAAWRDSGLPDGVLTVVQGGRETGATLAQHPGIDGLFFTGSSRAGEWLAELFARSPGKILALEMGGNNPLVAWRPRDLRVAALLTIQSAFLTAGQRCTCARRLIVPADAEGDAFISELTRQIAAMRVGPFTDRPEPFMGPMISAAAANHLIASQDAFIAAGADPLVYMTQLKANTGLVSPGLLDVTTVHDREDEEFFGPLLQVVRVPDFDAALAEANATCYGLAAGLLADDAALYKRFRDELRAGLINWNQPLTGASGAAPFGGIGASGNHRPSGFFAADYCSFPVASLEQPELKMPASVPPGLAP